MKNQREFIKSSLFFKIVSFLPVTTKVIIFFLLIGLVSSQNVESQTGSSFDQPLPISDGETTGVLSSGESIFYIFSTSANSEYIFSLESGDSETDFDLFLHDSTNGEYLGRSNGLTYPEQISFLSLTENTILVQVFSLSSEGEFTLTISLTFETSEDSLPWFNPVQLFLPITLAYLYRKRNR